MMDIWDGDAGCWKKASAATLATELANGRNARRSLARERHVRAVQRAHANADRRVQRQFDTAEQRAAREWEAFGRRMQVWVKRLVRKPDLHEPRKKAVLISARKARSLPRYKAPPVDSRGRVAVYFRLRYAGLRSRNWRPGCTVDHCRYIFRDDALEKAIDGNDRPLSNMGDDVDEITEAWRVLEQVETAYRANAKVQHRIILNLPWQLDSRARQELVHGYCERSFGRIGLPYAAAIHRPDDDGDQRNFHAHIIFSTRPMERTAPWRWAIAPEKVGGIDDRDGIMRLRMLAAAHMNQAMAQAGHAGRYTHSSYADRGLDALPQVHLGPERTALHRAGNDVAAVESNAAIVRRNVARQRAQKIEAELQLQARMQHLVAHQLEVFGQRRRVRQRRLAADKMALALKKAATRVSAPTTCPTSIEAARLIQAKVHSFRAALPGPAPRKPHGVLKKLRAAAMTIAGALGRDVRRPDGRQAIARIIALSTKNVVPLKRRQSIGERGTAKVALIGQTAQRLQASLSAGGSATAQQHVRGDIVGIYAAAVKLARREQPRAVERGPDLAPRFAAGKAMIAELEQRRTRLTDAGRDRTALLQTIERYHQKRKTDERAADIARACAIVRQHTGITFFKKDGKHHVDLSRLSKAEQTLLQQLAREPTVSEAFVERYRRDGLGHQSERLPQQDIPSGASQRRRFPPAGGREM